METLRLDWSPLLLYTEFNINMYAPRAAGVYRLSYQKDDEPHVFYVGQDDNVSERLRDHSSAGETNACIQHNLQSDTCYFQFSPILLKKDRDLAERALYDHYGPECNQMAPPGEPGNINFV